MNYYIKDLLENAKEQYRIGFKQGAAIASCIWIVITLCIMFFAFVEIQSTINKCEKHLKKAYEITSH